MLNQEMLGILKKIRDENVHTFSNPKQLISILKDLTENNTEYNAIIRWIGISLSDFDAFNKISDDFNTNLNLAKSTLVSRLIDEGASTNIAEEVIGYWAALAGEEPIESGDISELQNQINLLYSEDVDCSKGHIFIATLQTLAYTYKSPVFMVALADIYRNMQDNPFIEKWKEFANLTDNEKAFRLCKEAGEIADKLVNQGDSDPLGFATYNSIIDVLSDEKVRISKRINPDDSSSIDLYNDYINLAEAQLRYMDRSIAIARSQGTFPSEYFDLQNAIWATVADGLEDIKKARLEKYKLSSVNKNTDSAKSAQNKKDREILLAAIRSFQSKMKTVKETRQQSQKLHEQSETWRNQGLCPHCGEKVGFFGKCKSCKKSPSEQLNLNVSASPLPRVIVSFGGYDWRILDVQKSKVLLLSDKIIDKQPYAIGISDMSWETCALRKYLNSKFFNRLTHKEKTLIIKTNNDFISLLSIDEVIKYFGGSSRTKQLKTSSGQWIDDEYNDTRIAEDEKGSASLWWLRSMGGVCVNWKGQIRVDFTSAGSATNGQIVNSEFGVRPALWIDADRI